MELITIKLLLIGLGGTAFIILSAYVFQSNRTRKLIKSKRELVRADIKDVAAAIQHLSDVRAVNSRVANHHFASLNMLETQLGNETTAEGVSQVAHQVERLATRVAEQKAAWRQQHRADLEKWIHSSTPTPKKMLRPPAPPKPPVNLQDYRARRQHEISSPATQPYDDTTDRMLHMSMMQNMTNAFDMSPPPPAPIDCPAPSPSYDTGSSFSCDVPSPPPSSDF